MAEKFVTKNRRLSQDDKAAISSIYSSLNDQAARFVQSIPLTSIKPFPGHPYHVLDNADMNELMESISISGVQEPIQLWVVNNPWISLIDGSQLAEVGDYILISGHRRKRACERLGLTSIPAILSTYTPDEAKLAMVDANLRRERVLPSEKAYAYKIKYDALKAQGRRSDLTSGQVGPKLRADEQLAQSEADSARQIKRFIRLTELLPELLEMVDAGELSMGCAVSLSYLDPPVQLSGQTVIPKPEDKPNQSQVLKKIREGTRITLEAADHLKKMAETNPKNPFTPKEVEEALSPGREEAELIKGEQRMDRAIQRLRDQLEPDPDEKDELEFEIVDIRTEAPAEQGTTEGDVPLQKDLSPSEVLELLRHYSFDELLRSGIPFGLADAISKFLKGRHKS